MLLLVYDLFYNILNDNLWHLQDLKAIIKIN